MRPSILFNEVKLQKFITTFSVKDTPRSSCTPVKNEELQIPVLDTIGVQLKQLMPTMGD